MKQKIRNTLSWNWIINSTILMIRTGFITEATIIILQNMECQLFFISMAFMQIIISQAILPIRSIII
ncbi:MAG: hypothetical protein AUG74_15245 [Bacteroidetes bacterium 13_1_20CM_4_60_6]|nr:MAG: hypothetical protein AUG74_15245 [Bacteroidetes bacterium 13_1_20CM_4_60_6]